MIFIFSIVLGAEYLSYVKSIETHARTFLPLNISAIGSVDSFSMQTKRLLAKIYYSPQSNGSISLRLVQNICRN